MRRTRSRSFSFAGDDADHQAAYVFPSRIIETVEIVFRTSFCAVPAFSRVEPARISGPTTHHDLALAQRGELRSRGTQTTHAVNAPAAAAARAAPSGERRAAARADDDDGVLGPMLELPRARAAPAASSSSAASRSLAVARIGAGDDGDDLVAVDAERRLALRRVERREAAGRACARVDEPAAAAKPLDDRVDDVRDGSSRPRPPPRARARPRGSSAHELGASRADRARHRSTLRASVTGRRLHRAESTTSSGGGQYHFSA